MNLLDPTRTGPTPNGKRATGHVRKVPRRGGDVYYASLRLPDGREKTRKLGRVWIKPKARPPAGYLTAGQAEAALQALLDGADPTLIARPSYLTFGQLCDEWLESRARELQPDTMADYRSGVESRIRPMIGDRVAIEEVTIATIATFRDTLVDEGLSPRTVNKYLTMIGGIFRHATDKHQLQLHNPALAIKRPKNRKRRLNQYLEAPEIYQLVDHAETEQEGILYIVAALTGLRFGELRALRWADIDWTGRQLRVSRNWPVKGEEKLPKSEQTRSVPLWDQPAAALDRLSRRGYQDQPDDYVFVDPLGGEILNYGFVARRAFHATCARAGLTSPRPGAETLRFHDLRHTYGTLAASIYASLHEVRRYMGHASVTTTEIYAHFIPQVDAAERGSAGLAAMLGTPRDAAAAATEPAHD